MQQHKVPEDMHLHKCLVYGLNCAVICVNGWIENTACPYSLIIILYNDQQMHNYLTCYHFAVCFDTVVSSSGSLLSKHCQVTQVCQMYMLVIQFKISHVLCC
jgi:hypothetical protein